MIEANGLATDVMIGEPIIRESDKQLKAQLDQIEQVFRSVEEIVVEWSITPSRGDSPPRQLPSELVIPFTEARGLFFSLKQGGGEGVLRTRVQELQKKLDSIDRLIAAENTSKTSA